jgi:FKBP-type peptidyl-prolyl cis-trans isomerase (trigger factor)
MRRVTTALIAALALLGLVAAGLLATGCGSDQSSSGSVPSDAVATVGSAQISKADFQQLMTQAQTQMKASGMTVPKQGTATYDHYVAQIVQFLVQEQIVAQSAKDLGVSVTDQQVAAQVTQLVKAYGGETKVLALLKQQGMTMELLKRSIKGQALAQAALAKVATGVTVSDAEIQAYWDAHKSEYQKQKKTNTLAKAKTTIKQTLLSAKQQKLWSAWLDKRVKELGVTYADGYDPAKLLAAASALPSASSSATP